MSCGKCGGKKVAVLCPVSLGLAVGLVGFFSAFIWSLWMMHYGVPAEMAAHMPAGVATLSGGFVHALWALLHGFLLGFFVALFYDVFRCCFKKCCRKSDDKSCGCSCGTSDKSAEK